MKNKWLTLAVLAAVIVLSSCASRGVPHFSSSSPSAITVTQASGTAEEYTGVTGNEAETAASRPIPSWISDKRVSVYRNGLNRCFTLSESGIYCVVREKNGTYVLYCDKQSDQFIKLCSRVDCPHSDESCDAYLDDSASVLGYYKGKLYYIKSGQMSKVTRGDGRESFERLPAELWRMDPDGRNKQLAGCCWDRNENITGYGSLTVTDGYIEGIFKKVGEDGNVEYSHRYTNLDHPGIFAETAGSIQFPAEGFSNGSVIGSDGEKIIIQYVDQNHDPGADREGIRLSLYAWDPAENRIAYIGDRPLLSGYFGAETAFIVEEGIVKQWDYRTETGTPLFDTGIRTRVSLSALPDCLAVWDTYEYQELSDGVIPEVVIRFYDWNYRPLGECGLSFDRELTRYGDYIFGETEDRILLVKDGSATRPDYYIEKSDFGSGNITLHEYNYPEMDLWE